MRFRPRAPQEVSVNLTPLIDVVLLLLIFFMVTTTFTRESQLDVELPRGGGSDTAAQGPLVLAISAAGRYRIDDETVSPGNRDRLQAVLGAAMEGRDDRSLVIRADAATAHQAVVSAMDVAAGLGVQRVAIATAPANRGE